MICNKCNKDKSETSFSWKNSEHTKISHVCKECHNIFYGRKWYEKNRDWQIRSVAERRRENKPQIRSFILDYLKTHPCLHCGETDPVVLEFHHRDGKTKRANIGHIYGTGFSWNVIQKEVDKCDVLCANCHRRLTAKEQGWYKLENMR